MKGTVKAILRTFDKLKKSVQMSRRQESAELTQNVSVSVAPHIKNDSPHFLKLIELM